MADIDVVHKPRSHAWVIWVVIALAVLVLLWFMLGGTGGAGAGGTGTAPATFHLESGSELARALASWTLPHA
jgi:hypothetical protein